MKIAVLLLCSCAVTTPEATHRAALTSMASVSDFGGVPDDGLSDRAAIQAAIDAVTARPDGGTVLLGPGRWTLDRPPLSEHPYDPYSAISTHSPHPLVIRGVGPETVLELVGDQGATATILIGIDPGAQHVRITELGRLRDRADEHGRRDDQREPARPRALAVSDP